MVGNQALRTLTPIAALIILAVGACGDSPAPTVPVTVLSAQAGQVMNENAPVILGESTTSGKNVEVGTVASIEAMPNGQTALHLAIDPSRLNLIPVNVLVKIAPPTTVYLIPPASPAPQHIQAGQVLAAQPS